MIDKIVADCASAVAGVPDGATVLVGGNGIVLSRSSDGDAFMATTHPDGVVLSSVLVLGPGEYTVVGETGVSFYQP